MPAPEELSPIDILRQQAELPPVTTDTPEFGLGTDATRIVNAGTPATAPLRVKLAGDVPAAYGPLTLGRIIEDIFTIQPTVTVEEWRRFRTTVGRILGFLPVLPENDDHD
jgi:hypothetical protein